MRRLAGLLLVGVLLAIAPWAHAGPSPTKLLERYKPILVLHPAERFAPAPVDAFVADSDLKRRTANGSWEAATGVPFPPPEAPGCTEATCWRLDERSCSANTGLASVDCYAAAEAARPATPTVYGASFRGGGRIALQYWLFYRYDFWSPKLPQSDEFWKAHEGDWESVTVVLDARERPLYVAASRHCNGARRVWSKAPRQGQRPVVYVSLGSHSHYFAAGARVEDPSCWPSEAVTIYKAYGVAMLDHAAAGRRISSLRLVQVTATSPTWMTFPGSWGEDQYARFPNATFMFGTGPRGPRFHDLWRQPFATPAGWPAE
jgi:VPS62-like protein